MSISIRFEHGNDYVVTIDDGRSEASYTVTVWPSDVDRYAAGATPEELVEAAFEFLLERESKESILKRFELPAIERYFPEFPQAMAAKFR